MADLRDYIWSNNRSSQDLIFMIDAELEDPINSTTHANITMNELPP